MMLIDWEKTNTIKAKILDCIREVGLGANVERSMYMFKSCH